MSATRWHWDDPVSWAQKQGWYEIYMKALTGELGEDISYWPERFTVEWLRNERRSDSKAFSRQYQNEVTPDEGLIFERVWFEDRFDYPPGEIRMVINSWDTAFGKGRNRSYSAGWTMLVTPDWHIYLVNLLRGQIPYSDLREAVITTAERSKANYVIIEAKQSGHALVQDDRVRLRMKDCNAQIVEWQPFGQKGSPTRLEANERISSVCAARRVHLPSEYFCRKTGQDWLPAAEQEIFSYPEGQNDDIVDAKCQAIFWVEEQRMKSQRWIAPPPVLWSKSDESMVVV